MPDGTNALGPYFAACLASGEVFKHLRGLREGKGRFIEALYLSLWDFEARDSWEALTEGEWRSPFTEDKKVKRDDCNLTLADLANVRTHAERLLCEAGANGRLPTPVDDLVAAARLAVAKDVSLDQGFLTRLYRKIAEPVRRAIDKVLGLLDRRDRTIYLDRTVHKNKEPFLCLHETGHEFLPWQRDTFSLLEDCQQTLDPEVQDHFEREANVFACEVLFQLDRFEEDAADCPFGLMSGVGAFCWLFMMHLRLGRRRGTLPDYPAEGLQQTLLIGSGQELP